MFTAGSPALIDGVLFDRRVSCRTLGGRRAQRRVRMPRAAAWRAHARLSS